MSKELSNKNIEIFQNALLSWGKVNFQDFPWRATGDPYRILVSEFMLHRTRASQVKPVYEEFIDNYPSLNEFLRAEDIEIRKKLETLGLSWRTENLIRALREFQIKYQAVPNDYQQLKSIHGIGQYIAGATVCFSSNTNSSLVDTNTLRVIGRFWGFDFNEGNRKKKETREKIAKVTFSKYPRNLYYAIIDLAHMICKVTDPDCHQCPLISEECMYFENREQN